MLVHCSARKRKKQKKGPATAVNQHNSVNILLMAVVASLPKSVKAACNS